VEEVISPFLKPNGVIVQTAYSLISTGTEGMKAKEGKMSYLGKARARPDQVKKVFETIKQQGLNAAYSKAMNKLDSLTPLGYSLSGTVTEVGCNVTEFIEGQRVACAGGGYANHAEINYVPMNLVVAVPENVSMQDAAFTTVGAIAMQAYRQSEIKLGENACIIGLGLIGQLLSQILNAAGVSVIGFDLLNERCKLAKETGAFDATVDRNSLKNIIDRLTDGSGVDCIFITSGGDSNEPVEIAAEIARDRAVVVDVGKSRLDLPWQEYYEKELDVRFSRSYGPGRYDTNYEELGIDYPIGYVRWTERRNMVSFLRLLSEKKIDLEPIISGVYPFFEAEAVYEKLAKSGIGLAVLFEYQPDVDKPCSSLFVNNKQIILKGNDSLRIGVIGAGNYASSMLLPVLKKMNQVDLVEVATSTSLSSENARRKFGFKRTSTNYKNIIDAEDVDAVIIATRHSTHAGFTAEALAAGKAAFVEKPLAIDFAGTEIVRQALVESGNGLLQVGFNRRFSPFIEKVDSILSGCKFPLVINYRVHAGKLEKGSWYLDSSEGSRFVGEAGHFFDVFAYLTKARPISVTAKTIRPDNLTQDDLENVIVIVEYDDGSVGNLLYLTQGDNKVPKEYMEVFGGGLSVQMNNFESLYIFKDGKSLKPKLEKFNKGHKEGIENFVDHIKRGQYMPIAIDSLLDTTLVTLATKESIKTCTTVYLKDLWIS
jgi:predicted dehydrogenase/threonine dehydrogenase-like Zn-dependent dehydrogenase